MLDSIRRTCGLTALVAMACTGCQREEAQHRPSPQAVRAEAPAMVSSAAPAIPARTELSDEAIEREYSAAHGKCLRTGEAAEGVTVAMADCNNGELARQDARLNAAYKIAMAARTSDQQSALRTAQRAWIEFRDAKCQEDLEGGTLDILNVGSCLLNLTTRRAVELEQMDDSGSDMSNRGRR